ncbi:MAG: cob(I)yrinic acid a,c-diamide adenosyltransferase [Thermoproteota archaeon]|nr:cob(I)yrinic acid a,c-diamide adenosyltransferase [Thermoproteota archaeon]
MKIYTKTGDKGETGLFDGTRVKKSNKRIIAYGNIDEVNSHLGCLLFYLKTDVKLEDLTQLTLEIQRRLFVLGSDLANPDYTRKDYPRISNDDVIFIEKWIDQIDSGLSPLKSFILPGGSLESSLCHVIRTVVRRSEIQIAELFLEREINSSCLVFINRLSDLFFILAREINRRKGLDDVIWSSS